MNLWESPHLQSVFFTLPGPGPAVADEDHLEPSWRQGLVLSTTASLHFTQVVPPEKRNSWLKVKIRSSPGRATRGRVTHRADQDVLPSF